MLPIHHRPIHRAYEHAGYRPDRQRHGDGGTAPTQAVVNGVEEEAKAVANCSRGRTGNGRHAHDVPALEHLAPTDNTYRGQLQPFTRREHNSLKDIP